MYVSITNLFYKFLTPNIRCTCYVRMGLIIALNNPHCWIIRIKFRALILVMCLSLQNGRIREGMLIEPKMIA